uniref:Uncharacterized protein n=1 Tax=Octopus bimaculoides TaxID=37653 RepID=A0A0L8G1J4_OCTBM
MQQKIYLYGNKEHLCGGRVRQGSGVCVSYVVNRLMRNITSISQDKYEMYGCFIPHS